MKRILTVLRPILDDNRSSQGAGTPAQGFCSKSSWIYCSEEGTWTCISYLTAALKDEWRRIDSARVVFKRLLHCLCVKLSSDTAVPLVGPSLAQLQCLWEPSDHNRSTWGVEAANLGSQALMFGLRSPCFGSEPWKHPWHNGTVTKATKSLWWRTCAVPFD